jgi:anti-sigma-K factor RskA
MTDTFDELRPECREVDELLDAYALGALERSEAEVLERHVADCLRCWEELSKSQRTAGLLAISVPLHAAPSHLGDRLISRARREGETPGTPVWQRIRPGWRGSVGAAAAAGACALVFAAFLQVQLSGLRGDNDELAEQLSAANSELEQQQQIVAVLSASDNQKLPMDAAAVRSQAESVYNWSRDSAAGFILCSNFPALPENSVYQVWFTRSDQAEPIATFLPQDGACQIPMDMSRLDWRPEGIGISVEPAGGSEQPTGRWFAYAAFPDRSGSGQGGGLGLGVAVAAIGP